MSDPIQIPDIDEDRQEFRDVAKEYREEARRAFDSLEVGTVEANWHQGRTDNPHETNKDHIGLGLMDNFPISGEVEIDEGGSVSHFVTVNQLERSLQAHTPEDDVNLLIGTPLITQPTTGSTGLPRRPVIKATPFTYNDQLELIFERREYQVDLVDGDFSAPVVQWQEIHTEVSVVPNQLEYLTEYKVRVRDRVVRGEYSDWSQPLAFQIKQYDIYQSRFTFPITGTGVDRKETFLWQSENVSDPEDRYTLEHYRLQFSTQSDFSTLVKEVLAPQPQHEITDDLPWETTLYARVRPEWSDTPRVPPWSTPIEFTVGAYRTVALGFLAPVNGTSFTKGTVFRWDDKSVADPEGLYTLQHYVVEVSTANDFSNVIHSEQVTQSEWAANLGSLSTGQVYFFRVKPVWQESVATPWSYPISVEFVDPDLPYVVTPANLYRYQLRHALKAHDGGVILYHEWQVSNDSPYLCMVEWRKVDGTRQFYECTRNNPNDELTRGFPHLVCWAEELNCYIARTTFDDRNGSGRRFVTIYKVTDDFQPILYTQGGGRNFWITSYHRDADDSRYADPYYLGGRLYVASTRRRRWSSTDTMLNAAIEQVDPLTMRDEGAAKGFAFRYVSQDGNTGHWGSVSLVPFGYVTNPAGSELPPDGLLLFYYGTYSAQYNLSSNGIVACAANFLDGEHNQRGATAYSWKSGSGSLVNLRPRYLSSNNTRKIIASNATLELRSDYLLFTTQTANVTRPGFMLEPSKAPLGLSRHDSGDYLSFGYFAESITDSDGNNAVKQLRRVAGTLNPMGQTFTVDPNAEKPYFSYMAALAQGQNGFIDWYNTPIEPLPSGGEKHPFSTDLEWINLNSYPVSGPLQTNNSIYFRNQTGAANYPVFTDNQWHMAASILDQNLHRTPTTQVPDFLK